MIAAPHAMTMALAPAQLPLRDVHLSPAPSWWPPAPGWWLVIAAGVLVLGWVIGRSWRRRAARRRWQAMFERELDGIDEPAQALAAMSVLLRRAARRVEPRADRLQGDAWLGLLDGRRGKAFTQGPGRVLLDGGFRRTPPVADLDAVRRLAGQRFAELMAGRR